MNSIDWRVAADVLISLTMLAVLLACRIVYRSQRIVLGEVQRLRRELHEHRIADAQELRRATAHTRRRADAQMRRPAEQEDSR